MVESKKGGLGKGLAALIPNNPRKLTDGVADYIIGGDPSLIKDIAVYKEIPIDDISPNPKQPRKVFDQEGIDELIHSIKEFGILQPIVVRRVSRETTYELVMGERRWRAAKASGLEYIPAIIRKTEDIDMLRDALLENIHRVQLNPLEEAAAYQQLLEEFNVSHEILADKIGKSRPAVTNTIRLLKLPINVQKRVAAGVLTAGHARALIKISSDIDKVEEIAAKIVKDGLSVRDTEELVGLIDVKKPANRNRTKRLYQRYEDHEEELAKHLDTQVQITQGKNKGKISIFFSNEEDLDRIYSVLRRVTNG